MNDIHRILDILDGMIASLSEARDKATGDEKTRLRRLCRRLENIESDLWEIVGDM